MLYPVVVPQGSGVELSGWIVSNAESLQRSLAERGAILFRGFGIQEAAEFEAVCRCFAPKLTSYVGGGSPRTRVTGDVYTSTEYASSVHIPLHTEASYLAEIPNHIWFFCQIPPMDRGETPLGDMRQVLQQFSDDLISTFERFGLLYVNNLHDGSGFGKSWRDTFQCNEPEEVERILRAKQIEFAWNPDGGLRTMMRAPTVRHHPATGHAYWANQAVNWHWADLPGSTVDSLIRLYGDAWGFPKSVFLGDGTPIEPEVIRRIREVLDAEEVTFSWEQGDVLLLDNHWIAHGRRPFTGNRKILVAMS